MLNAIGGLDKVNKGKIYIDEKKLTKATTSKIDDIRNLKIGYIFQNYHLMNHFTVFENVALVLKMVGLKKKEEIAKRVNYILEVLGMYPYRNRLAYMLSGGQKQRVAIARAIVKNPNIIIADEPTGNLDSKNSIEIMNIIKAISKEKLVILVTHEKELAKFYATRLIKVVDGNIVSDEQNQKNQDLDYQMYHKIYLKDMPVHETIKQEGIQLEYYYDKEAKAKNKIKMAIKDGNIYIQSDKKIEIVDEASSIELVNSHYKKLSKKIYENYQFNNEEIINDHYKKRYTSINNVFTLLIGGVKKILSYSPLKKILLLGFFISSMFIVYAISNLFGITNIKDEKFVATNRDYLSVVTFQNEVSSYLEEEHLDFIDYVLPGDSKVDFEIEYPDYYQTIGTKQRVTASIVATHRITKQDIILGDMPQSQNEIVLDKMVVDKILEDNLTKQIGITTPSQLLGRAFKLSSEDMAGSKKTTLPPFMIVGITNQKSPSVYLAKENFINLLSLSQSRESSMSSQENSDVKLVDVNLVSDEITMKKGRMPQNDYEIIVNNNYATQMKLNKTIQQEVNGQKLKVVGYYENKYGKDEYYATLNTVKYQMIEKSQNLMICPKQKEQAMNYFLQTNRNIEDTYQKDKNTYIKKMKPQIISSMTVASVILGISLTEIFLMMRSSFLSRKKEVGILRAIGVKKMDIYKMFLGEILAIDIFICTPGIAFMSYILYNLSQTYYFADQFILNTPVVGISVLIAFGFNIFIGLLPVHHTLRKTPAQILSGNAID